VVKWSIELTKILEHLLVTRQFGMDNLKWTIDTEYPTIRTLVYLKVSSLIKSCDSQGHIMILTTLSKQLLSDLQNPLNLKGS